ncbi:F-box protein At4g09920-like [Papaver somniferum]|uniref:F-box protein At4g09920-like n=1 Tax=Papaver somniferum TaxID=3469 RepID=UPI000E7039C7|nr:F-box protein At4g09920-like [Papaver somniferum]
MVFLGFLPIDEFYMYEFLRVWKWNNGSSPGFIMNYYDNNMGVGEDRISKLPDPLVRHMLSFLPTKCAVSTSILSKRWKNVWVSIPVLDVLDMGPPRIILTGWRYYVEQATIMETNKFMDHFMDRVLIQRNMLNIKKFCLNCENGYFDHKRVNAWITTAIKCEVEEFVFYGCGSCRSNDKMIPESLFTCESLTTLDFQFPELYYRLELPESISLPRLKILRLTNITYDDEKLARKLFSSCRVLEELCLTNCCWQLDLCVSAPRLKSFTVANCMTSNMEDAKIKIDAPNLMSFTFCDWLPEDLVVDSFPLLQDADICFESESGVIDKRSGPLSKFIEKFCYIKFLKISGANFKVNFTGNGGANVSTFKVVPHCLVVSLKSIEIQKFTGYLEMVNFVLKHGRVLQMVIIETYYSVDLMDRRYSYCVDPMDRLYNKKRYNKKNMEAKRVEALNKSSDDHLKKNSMGFTRLCH